MKIGWDKGTLSSGTNRKVYPITGKLRQINIQTLDFCMVSVSIIGKGESDDTERAFNLAGQIPLCPKRELTIKGTWNLTKGQRLRVTFYFATANDTYYVSWGIED